VLLKLGPRAAALAAAGSMLVAGCGSAHPGAAADLDGYRIPMATVDEQAAALCQAPRLLGAAEGQNIDQRTFRVTVLGVKVQHRRAQLAADELGIEVPDPQVTEQELFELGIPTDDLSGAELDSLIEFFTEYNRTQALLPEISERVAEETGAAGEELNGEVFDLLEEQVDDVEVDPRLGLGPDLQEISSSGSLSVPVSDGTQPAADDPALESFVAGLPAAQSCV
jgi:hypothetical protein